MNLLPKSHKEFSDKGYWDNFFKRRGNKAFEWYGEYLELCGILHKYIKQKDLTLITGCGNSSMSSDLYDVGYQNITNIDISEVVIRQMKTANNERENMKFLCMDATNMSFGNEEFNVVLDKGTLDALMPDNAPITNEVVDKYFSEIKRVLKLGGRFICISLLQSHILTKLLKVFCDKTWMFRVVRCHEAEFKNSENSDGRSFPVFAIIATKFKEMSQLILEICLAGEKMVRLKTPEELQDHVKSTQETVFITNSLSRTSLDNDQIALDLMPPGEDSPRYTLFVVDQQQTHGINKYAVFIVPQGRESEWLFGTPAGRRELQDTANFGRLVVVLLRRGYNFENLDAVKDELTPTAKMLIPYGFTGPIPFLSIGNDVGRRVKVFEGSSKVSGDFVVEDVKVEEETYRRLVFLENQFLVQSEAKLKPVKRKNKIKMVVDYGEISLYHRFMCVGVHKSCGKNPGNVAVLGLGGGSLCMFIKKCYDDVKITAVDLDPAMADIAVKYFELIVDDHLEVQVKDGMDFLRDEAKNGKKYEAVMFDMDSKDKTLGLSCPPKQFLDNDALELVKTILTDHGIFILNLVCRDTQLNSKLRENLERNFKHLASVKLYEEVNEIIFATNNDKKYTEENLEAIVKNFNSMARKKKLVDIKCVDLKEFLQNLDIMA